MRAGLVAIVMAGLTGCAGAPSFTRTDYVETADILKSVERELCTAVEWAESNPDIQARILAAGLDIRKFVASATVGLSVAVETGASGDATLVVPVSAGSAGLTASLGSTVQRTRETVLKVYYPFSELECDLPASPGTRRIAGNLGLAEWIKESTRILIEAREVPVAYSYSVGFALRADAGGGPFFSIIPLTNTVRGAGSLGASREIAHSLSVTVVEIQPDAALAARYRIPDDTRRRLERESDIEVLRGATR